MAGVAQPGRAAAPRVNPMSQRLSAVRQHIMLTPREMQWTAGPPSLPPGGQIAVLEGDPTAPNKLFTFRARLPANYRIAPHWHSADEHVTVISGRMRFGMGETFDPARMREVGPGSFVAMPAAHAHYVVTDEPTELQIHAVGPWSITYINPADDPRNAR